MRQVLRAAASAAGPLCLFGAVAVSAPTFAETPVVLASVTLPPAALQAEPDDPYTVPAVRNEVGPDEIVSEPAEAAAPAGATLASLVDARISSDTRDAEHECLAISVYFEAKGEPLSGQLAVAQTLINRAASGRFPASLCGVVRQRGQFSFVHGGALPAVPRASAQWREAVAVAAVARDDLWHDAAPGALFFHASRVAPNWKLTRVARLGNHIFYR